MPPRRNIRAKTTPSKTTSRTAARPEYREPSAALRYLVLAALAAVLVWVAGKPAVERIAALPVFTVRQVVVEDAEHLDREKIIKSSGLHPGGNIFQSDLRRAAKGLRRTFVAQDFTVFRKLPDTIVIRVLERKPVALVNVGRLVGVDADGVPLPHIGADMVETLPIITGVSSEDSLALPSVRKRLMAGLHLLDAITRQSPGVEKRISEINVSNTSTLGISLIDTGLEVIIGENGWTEKIPNLEKVLALVSGRADSVRTVDMRFGEKIFIRK